MKKKESGITLLSLCLALIVMIILAGIALRLGVGDNGLIGRTTNTIDQYSNATDQEQEGLNRFVDEFNQIINDDGIGNDSGGEDITITDRPTISLAGWNRTGGIVEISTQSGYITQYRIGRTGQWLNYDSQVNVDNGDTIYARYKNDEGVSSTVSQIVEDTNGPDVTLVDLTVNGGEITITVTSKDNEMGMPEPPTYNYYIRPSGDNYFESVGHNTTGEFTFTGLEGNQEYDIRVSTTDLAGNQGSLTTNSQTGSVVEIPDLVVGENIFFELDPSGLTQGPVNVTIRVEPELEEPLELEYSINGTDNWQKYEGPIPMTDNGRVYARVTDGDESSNVVYTDVTNIDKTDPDVSAEVQYPTGSDSITVVVTPNEDDDGFVYDYYIKEKDQPDDAYVKDEGPDNEREHTFDGLEQGKEYDIKVVVTDPAGNDTIIEIPAVLTGEVPSGIENGNITLSANPTTPTNGNVTVTITDNLQAGYDIQYSITYNGQGEGTAQNYTGPFEVTDNCTIKAWFTDGTNAGDPATLEIANIDREAPVASAEPESETNKTQEKTVTVKVTENGSAGFNTNQGLNYAWTQSNSTVPEGLTSLPGTNADGANEISFTVPSGTDLTGTYYLYVAPVADRASNSSEARFFGPYEFDNTVPRPEFGPDGSDEWNQHYDVEIKFPDGDGDEVSDIEYEWTKGDEKPTFPEGEDNHVKPGDTIPSPDDATGDDWYLNVKIEDENGNESIVKVGPFYIDNEGPSITYPEGDFDTPKQEHGVTVTVEDPHSGLASDMPKYVWVNGDDTPSDDTLKNGETFTSGEEIKTPAGETGDNWHLWIYAEDELGNASKEDIGPFNIDNNGPQVTFNPNGNTDNWEQSYTVTVDPTDGQTESGINEGSLKYQWTQSSTPPDENSFDTNGTPFTPGSAISSPADVTGDNWYLWVYVEDNAGNSNIVGTTNPFQIDNTDPTLELEMVPVEGVSASNTIKVKVTASDSDSGIDESTYKYYIQEKDGEIQETSNFSKDGDTLTFPNLKADTEYTIYVEVTDNAGNTITKQITIRTGTVAGGESIIEYSLSEDDWTNQPVDVTLSLANGYDGYKIEYKLPDGDWTEYTGPITVSENQTIQVRPVDPSNNRGAESSINITNIDTVSPSLTAEPNSVNDAVQSQSIKVTATDSNTDTSNIAGFNTGIQIRYGWSTSQDTAPTYDQTATSSNSLGATSAEFNITTPKQTGTYYLWIAGNSFADRAGNQNAVFTSGPYVLDNQGPTISFDTGDNTTYAKEHTAIVNAGDAVVTKYVWQQQNSSDPSEGEFTGTFTSGEPIIKNTGSGDWYLWVYAEDSLGNVTIECSDVFKFDNTPADVTLSPSGNSTPAKSNVVTVNVSNDNLSNMAVQKYLWTTQETGIDESSFTSVDDTFTGSGPVRGEGYNGNYYLWIYVEDEAGNTTVVRSETTFNFDNTNPQVTFTPNTNTSPAQSQTTHVNVTDTNLDASSLKYVWTANNTAPNADQITNPLTNDSDVSINGETGNRYLWVLAQDTAGNEVIIGSGAFLVDNNPPSVSLDYEGTTNSITAKVSAEDDYSGIASYEYTLQEVDGDYNRTETRTNPTFTFDSLPANRNYTLTVVVTDGSGNSRTVTYQGQISTGTIPGGSAAVTITPSENDWTNKPITITLTNTSGNTTDYHIVYRIGADGPETDYTTPFTVNTNTTIYAWLEDRAGNQGSPASAEIARIDTVAPEVTAQPTEDTSSSQTKTITVTAVDTNYDSNIAGFNASQSLKYAWSTSNTQEPASYETMLGTNTEGQTSISYTLNPEGLDGSYYLWIQANSFEDQAGNTSAVYHSGPYGFDNTIPDIVFGPDGSTDYEKEYDVELTFPDGDQDEIRDIEYVWTKGEETDPDFDNNGTPVDIGGGEDGKTIIPSPPGETGDDWYLNVKVEDEYGNEDIITVGPFYLDNEGPTIDFNEGDYSTPKQEHTITVTVDDDRSGLKTDMPKYVWVNGDGRPTDEELKNGTTFTSGQPITTPDNENGNNWHLWIYAEDELGNQTVEDIGPFNLDNTAPIVEFDPNGSTSWQKTHTVTVNPTDGNAGINEGTLKYQWTQSETAPDAGSFDTGTYTGTFTPGSQISSPNEVTGNNWYLWIYVEDNAGNSNIIGTNNPFYIDNTDPLLNLSVEGTATSSTIVIRANASDADSQINESSYRYYIRETNGGNYGEVQTDGNTHRFEGLQQNTEYTIRVEVSDNAGNTIYKEITVTTGSVASGDEAINYQITPQGWTNSAVTLTLSLNSGYEGNNIQYSESVSGPWTRYELGGAGITVDRNKTIYAQLIDASGNAGSIVPIQITTIDNVAPTVSAEPANSNEPAKTRNITITAQDSNYDSNVAGFGAGATIRYGWSTSNTTEPASYQPATSTNSEGAITATFNVTTPQTQTGTYYLWILDGSLSDRANNLISSEPFGPYILDNEAPSISFTPNGDSTYAKSHSVTVNAGDATVRKYVWTQSTEQPSNEQFTGTFTNETPIVKNSDSGDWYLWVYVEDSLGNSTTAHSEVFKFDNTAPTITFDKEGDSTARKSHEVSATINLDGYSDLDTSSFKYLWTESETGITESSFPSENTFENGVSITGSRYDGHYYLWVMAKDTAGNITIEKTDNTFYFDNTAPRVIFEPNGSDEWTNTPNVKVTVVDDNLDESSLKYGWAREDASHTSKINAARNGQNFENGDILNVDETFSGKAVLCIYARDTAGNLLNNLEFYSNSFLIDTDKPQVLEARLAEVASSDSVTITSRTMDGNAASNPGVDCSGLASVSYTITEVDGDYTETLVDNDPEWDADVARYLSDVTFTGLKPNTSYSVTIWATDAVGNVGDPYEYPITFTTSEIPVAEDAIWAEITPSTWTNQNVKVTLGTTETGYTIVYRTGSSTGEYADYNTQTGIVLDHNDTVYAKLKDSSGNLSSDVKVIDVAIIDKEKPTISANPPSDSNYTKNKEITVTATDVGSDSTNIAGFGLNQSLEYGWSSSNTTPPTSYTPLSGTNTAGAQQITFTAPANNNLNGQQYLWIQAGSVIDRATNSNDVAHFGPYYFDNSEPTLNGQITVTGRTSKSITVSVPEIVDTGSGVPSTPQYSYFIKKTTDGSYGDAKYTGSEQTWEYTELDDNTTYDIRVTFTDNAGNTGEDTTSGKTELVPTLDASNTTFTVYVQNGDSQTVLADDKVTNKPVDVEISVDSEVQQGYKLQYRIDDGNYTEYTGPVRIESNATISARLWDERNAEENVGISTEKAIDNIDTSLSDLGVIVKNEDPVDENTKVDDGDGNSITIPEGFLPLPDPDSDDPDNPKIEDGVIVQDPNGNQFVWIPVGTINLSTGGTATINYNRYTYANWVNGGTDSETNSMMIKTTSDETEYFVESLNTSEQQSAVSNGGFYLGRYEAGVSGGTARTESSGTSQRVEIKEGLDVYNWVTQSEARNLAENMYSAGFADGTYTSGSFTTNLTSSYAWDTALQFLQETIDVDADAGNDDYLTNSDEGNYYNTQYGGKTQTDASTLIKTGQTEAVKHLYDMGGNVYEWTTERYSNTEATKVSRGGFYGFLSTDEPVIGRFSSSNTADQAVGFRVALFLGAVDAPPKYMDDLQIGDYVAYTPDSASSYSLFRAYSGYQSDQTISQDTSLKWRVLNINNDGTVDLISARPTNTRIYLTGAIAYNNGVYLLNDIAAQHYSTSKYGGVTARSIGIEDIEGVMNANGLDYINSYSNDLAKFGETYPYSGNYNYPNLYSQEIGSGIDTQTVRTDGIDSSDRYYTSPTTETVSGPTSSMITVTQTYYDRLMNDQYYKNSTFYNLIHPGSAYWVASRQVNCVRSDSINFGLRRVEGNQIYGSALFLSNKGGKNGSGSAGVFLRPVVSLRTNIQLSSGDGSEDSPYQIVE